MSNESQSYEDLMAHLTEQVHFLRASAASYDQGFKGEAKRLAVAVRVLVHDTAHSRSLLHQIGKKAIPFVDTALPENPRNLLSHQGLTMMRVGRGDAEFVPRCLAPPTPGFNPPRQKGFEDWWLGVVVVDEAKRQFTRKDLVLALSNKEGGAHVDPKLDVGYAMLARHHSMGWQYTSGTIEEPVAQVELASVRQIAYEVLLTLDAAFPGMNRSGT